MIGRTLKQSKNTGRRCLRKLLTLGSLAVTMILSSCHGSKKTDAFTIPDEFDTSKNIEITFWAKNDTNKAQTDIYKNAISSFEEKYPNITVNLRLYTDYGKIYNDVITNIATSTTPNVCITYPDHIATYLTGENVVVPLDELFEDKDYGLGGEKLLFDGPTKEEIAPDFLKECSFLGHYYALPFMRSTEACYVNKTYVEKLGYTLPETLTWDFVWEVSEAALAKDDNGNYKVNGQKVMLPFVYKSTDNFMIQMLKQMDAPYSTQNGDILIFSDETKNFLLDLAKHTKTGAFSTFKISGYPGNFLNAGQCIFAIDSTAGATWMGSNAPLIDISKDALVDFETEVMMIPQVNPEHPKMISQGPSVCIFQKSDPQEVLASWLFVQYLISNDVQVAYSETEGYLPVTLKAQNSPEYQEYLSKCGEDNNAHYDVKIKASKLLMNNMNNTFVTPVFNGSTSLRDAAGQMIENVVKSVRRKEKVNNKYIDKMYKDVSSLYHLDQISSHTEGKQDLGKLPLPSLLFLVILATTWIFIGLIVGFSYFRKRKNK